MRTTLLSLLSIIVLTGVTPAEVSATTACTMDAKLCPDGVTYVGRDGNRNCEWQLCPGEKNECMPYLCNDGTTIDRCTPEGTTITYIAMPCLTHGGDIGTSAPFSDVPVTHANAEAIAYMKALGMIQGYTDGTFKPEATINRAECTKMMMKFTSHSWQETNDRGETYEQWLSHFSDVHLNDWYSSFLYQASRLGIVAGYPDSTFQPGRDVIFVEAAKMISVAIDPHDFTPPTSNPDDPWYKRFIVNLAMQNAIPTSINRFDQNITRGEMAEIIWRLKTGNTEKSSRTFEQLEQNALTETHGSVSTFHHINPAFSFQFPAGWRLSDDRGDMDIYITIPNTDTYIVLSYCDGECNGPLNECAVDGETRTTVPILGVKGCHFVYEGGREEWTKIGVPVNGTYFFTVRGTKDDLKNFWPLLAKIRSSLRME